MHRSHRAKKMHRETTGEKKRTEKPYAKKNAQRNHKCEKKSAQRNHKRKKTHRETISEKKHTEKPYVKKNAQRNHMRKKTH